MWNARYPHLAMPRHADSGLLNLAEVFHRVQSQMLAELAVGRLFEHASAAGAATEHHWLELFDRYLPKRYRAAPAFVIDCHGRRSRQIDIAIFDALYTPPLFPHASGLHLPAESVYAVFEVKPTFSKQWLRDAAEKAASVRALHRTSAPIIASGALRRNPIRPQPILAGLLATSSVWSAETFSDNLTNALTDSAPNPCLLPPDLCRPELYRLDLGCSLEHGAFECSPSTRRRRACPPRVSIAISTPDESLIFFILRLLHRLRAMGTAPAPDLMQYAQNLESLKTFHK